MDEGVRKVGGASTDGRRLCVFFFGPREMRLSAAVLALGIPWVVTVAPLITGIVLYTLGLSRLQLVAHATLCILCSFFIFLHLFVSQIMRRLGNLVCD